MRKNAGAHSVPQQCDIDFLFFIDSVPSSLFTSLSVSLFIVTHADKFIQKTRKLYLDTRTQRNMSKLNSELNEVQNIMTKNIQEVLGQGEKLESECA